MPSDPERLREFFAFRDFAHFIEVYLAVVDLIRTPEDIRLLTYEVAREMATVQNVRYAELTCTPYTSVLPRDATRGCRSRPTPRRSRTPGSPPSATSGSCCAGSTTSPARPGCRPPTPPWTTRSTTAPDALIGFGLGGPEIGVPRPQFQPHFDAGPGGRAAQPCRTPGRRPGRRRSGTRCATSAPSGSGTARRRRRTPTLLAHLAAEHRIPLEVCPSSNIATRAVATLDEHPIRTFRDAGVVVTVNSDDPPMFGTTLNREYEIAADLLGLDEAGVADLARTAVRASFLDDAGKRRLTDEIDAYQGAGTP